MARNPKDVMVSSYHFAKGMGFGKLSTETGDFKDFIELFMEGLVPIVSNYWEHLHLAWKQKDHSNFHFLFYEDMKKNISCEVKKLKDFLKLELSEGQITK